MGACRRIGYTVSRGSEASGLYRAVGVGVAVISSYRPFSRIQHPGTHYANTVLRICLSD
jgi:hypothetical protein